MNISMTKTTHPGKLPPADRLGIGSEFTDHMFLMNYTDREGWHNARIVPFGPISISPAASRWLKCSRMARPFFEPVSAT